MVALIILAGCAGDRTFRESKSLLTEGRIEEGLARLDQAIKENPDRVEYRTYRYRQRQIYIQMLLMQADNARETGRLDEAETLYRRVLDFEERNPRATGGLQAIEAGRRRQAIAGRAAEALKSGNLDDAERLVRSVLSEEPANTGAVEVRRKIEEAALKEKNAGLFPKANFRKGITLEFRDANLKSSFDVISRTAGINFIFDRDVKPDIKTTLFVRNSSIEDVINMLLVTNQLEKKVLSDSAVLIYPNTPAKIKEYQELAVRTFYLTNADPKQMMNTIKTILKTRDIVIDERLGTLTMRDTPGAIRLAEKLVASQDLADPEVVLEVEVLEVKRSRLTELGIQWPSQFTVLNIMNTNTVTTAGASIATTPVITTAQLTLDKLRRPGSGSIGIPNPAINLRGEDSDTNLLANPRIRVRNREKARIHIGDRVPVITATATANVGVAESVSYLDVGLKLEVEPRIYPDNDVAMKVGLEVSSIVREIKSSSGTMTYQLGTRDASTTLRLKDGETQALAGLINNEDRASASKVPGLGDIPLLGRLFSSQRNEGSKTEIVLLITPHIARNLVQPEAADMEFLSGTDSATGAPPLTLRPAAAAPADDAAQAAPPAPQSQTVPGSTPPGSAAEQTR